jgi:hypothetical protein
VAMGKETFSIGAHGMWRIRGGEKCEVLNQNYGEAVLHVSSLNKD